MIYHILIFLKSMRPSRRSIRHRQNAIIQLQALLNEPLEALPISSHRNGENASAEKKLTVEDVAKMFNTPVCMIQRIVNALNRFSNSDQFSMLSQVDVQKIIRILNSTLDVRALIFFAILDDQQDDFITREGFREFYETYLKGIKSFNRNRIPEYIEALLQKFHLQDVRINVLMNISLSYILSCRSLKLISMSFIQLYAEIPFY